jgi:hypothetical protein
MGYDPYYGEMPAADRELLDWYRGEVERTQRELAAL